MADLYQVLGVSKTASAAEIKKAYHKIARTCHPDVAKNDPKAADKFKEASCAYDILGDEKKRRQYDAGEIDEQGKPRAPFGAGFGNAGSNPYGSYGAGPGGAQYFYTNMGGGSGGFEGFDFADLFGGGGGGFEDLFRGARSASQGRSRNYAEPGRDVSYSLSIPFELSMTGGETSVRLSSGKQVKVKIPAGITDGANLRLRGQGEPGQGVGAQPGDAIIRINVGSHPVFKREGNDALMTLPITLKEAVLGAKVTIPTLTGKVALTVPPNTSSDKILRLKGKGVTGKGDLLVKIQVLLPDHPDEALEEFVKNWKPRSQNPRPFF